jgi:3-phenylpropionate/trans-cinnamate dioxygenase ferredoxin subunit
VSATGGDGVSATTLPLDELIDGTASRVDVGGNPVCVVRLGGDVYAIGDICSHAHVSLSEGEVWADEREIECPKHSSTFDLRTGEPTCLPATQPVPVYHARVEGGTVTISVGEDEP